MKAVEVHLIKEYDNSFLVYHEINPFSRWHCNPDFELVFIVKGAGKRMVGDHIDKFEDGDLVFMDPNLPHEWLCDDGYYFHKNGFQGEGIVIQFLPTFLGQTFFEIPENRKQKKYYGFGKRVSVTRSYKRKNICYYEKNACPASKRSVIFAFRYFSNIS